MKILLIDNYDSFTYNLFHYISKLRCKVDVIRNDKINSKDIKKKKYKKIVISPGSRKSFSSWKLFKNC
jgi:anthranilate/para-aminobenzoate synthase component II